MIWHKGSLCRIMVLVPCCCVVNVECVAGQIVRLLMTDVVCDGLASKTNFSLIIRIFFSTIFSATLAMLFAVQVALT